MAGWCRSLSTRSFPPGYRLLVRPLDLGRKAMKRVLALLIPRAIAVSAHAHVGSKDVYEEVTAGPSNSFVTIRTPESNHSRGRHRGKSGVPGLRSVPATSRRPRSDRGSVEAPTQFSGRHAIVGGLTLLAAQVRCGLWLPVPGRCTLMSDGAAGKASTSVPVAAMPLSIFPDAGGPWALISLLYGHSVDRRNGGHRCLRPWANRVSVRVRLLARPRSAKRGGRRRSRAGRHPAAGLRRLQMVNC